MHEIQVTMTELRQSLGNLVNRAAYGNEHIILVAHGEAKAALINIEDLRRLQQFDNNLNIYTSRYNQVVTQDNLIRERIQQSREAYITMTELRQSLGNLVNRAAYGSEHIVLVAHGEAKAALISVENLHRLKQVNANSDKPKGRYSQVLAKSDILRERIQRWQEAYNVEMQDSVDILNQIRGEHDDELIDLR